MTRIGAPDVPYGAPGKGVEKQRVKPARGLYLHCDFERQYNTGQYQPLAASKYRQTLLAEGPTHRYNASFQNPEWDVGQARHYDAPCDPGDRPCDTLLAPKEVIPQEPLSESYRNVNHEIRQGGISGSVVHRQRREEYSNAENDAEEKPADAE
jgi:hypothetical protein